MIPFSGCPPWPPDHPRTLPRTGDPTPPRGARPLIAIAVSRNGASVVPTRPALNWLAKVQQPCRNQLDQVRGRRTVFRMVGGNDSSELRPSCATSVPARSQRASDASSAHDESWPWALMAGPTPDPTVGHPAHDRRGRGHLRARGHARPLPELLGCDRRGSRYPGQPRGNPQGQLRTVHRIDVRSGLGWRHHHCDPASGALDAQLGARHCRREPLAWLTTFSARGFRIAPITAILVLLSSMGVTMGRSAGSRAPSGSILRSM